MLIRYDIKIHKLGMLGPIACAIGATPDAWGLTALSLTRVPVSTNLLASDSIVNYQHFSHFLYVCAGTGARTTISE